MTKINALLVKKELVSTVDGVLNKFRINLNDWDRSKVLYNNGEGYVIYTIVCTKDQFESIKQIINY